MDSANDRPAKKKLSLNVVGGTTHKGFGAGTIDLSQVSSVIIDRGEAYIDIGAMHAKSRVERGIRFTANKEEVPNGRPVWVVWVAVDRDEHGFFYGGIASCEMLIDEEARIGWKILADHVNRMDAAIKRKVMLDNLGPAEKAALRKLLVEHNAQWWERSPQALKDALA